MRTLIVFLLVCLFGFGYYKLVVVKRQKVAKPLATQPVDSIPVRPEIKPEIRPEIKPEVPEKPALKEVYSSYSETLIAAKAHDKSIFLYFGAEWCHWCKVMKAQTLADADVKAKLKDFVLCIVNTDADAETTRKFKVGGIPDYMVVSGDGTVLIRGSGFKPKQDFLNWLSPQNKTLLSD